MEGPRLGHGAHHGHRGHPVRPFRADRDTALLQRPGQPPRGRGGVALGDHPAGLVAQLARRGDSVAPAHPGEQLGLDLRAQPVLGDRGDLVQQRPQMTPVQPPRLQRGQRRGQPCTSVSDSASRASAPGRVRFSAIASSGVAHSLTGRSTSARAAQRSADIAPRSPCARSTSAGRDSANSATARALSAACRAISRFAACTNPSGPHAHPTTGAAAPTVLVCTPPSTRSTICSESDGAQGENAGQRGRAAAHAQLGPEPAGGVKRADAGEVAAVGATIGGAGGLIAPARVPAAVSRSPRRHPRETDSRRSERGGPGARRATPRRRPTRGRL